MENSELMAIAQKYNKRPREIGAQNKQIKWLKDIANNKIPNTNRVRIIEGIWAHKKAIECDIGINSTYLCPKLLNTAEGISLAEQFMASAENIFVVSAKTFSLICEVDHNASGIISACTHRQWNLSDIQLSDSAVLLILDGLEIPGNVGTIMRSVDGAGADGIIFTNRKVRHNHPKLLRSSQCTCFSLPIVDADYDELFSWLSKSHVRILLLDTESQTEYHDADYTGRVALVAGSERYGISKRWYDIQHNSLYIQMKGIADSLNVAVAVSAVIYEAKYKQEKRKK